MIRTQIYLPKSQIEELRRVSAKQSTTMSAVIRDALEDFLGRKVKNKSRQQFQTSFEALAAIKKLKQKGPKDLSSRVDEYLYGNI